MKHGNSLGLWEWLGEGSSIHRMSLTHRDAPAQVAFDKTGGKGGGKSDRAQGNGQNGAMVGPPPLPFS